ncbi:ImpA family type VI secretion system protein [Arvimicrobium flavum]|uniref:type VI secretion system protein TssA n=1 Tax=Arvimicrobium flavum TaxID=3393320 RepID=UPI00237B6113|nr:type VI secretion system ImpA family N-terminal domain-containing protein [Mesorhizobium shangrilense]
MRFDDIAEAISEADPCGPDLDEEGDEAYLNYVLSAAGRIPESFYQKDPNSPVNDARYVPFDRTKVDLKSEIKSVAALLARTKDLRLLALEARFQCLAGQVVGFCECLQGMARLVGSRWDGVHPRGADGDFTLRQNTISGLDDQTSVLLPLGYAPLVNSRKIGAVSLRDYLVATGEVQPRPDDRQVGVSDVLEAIQQADNRVTIEALDQAVNAAARALRDIDANFIEAAGHASRPSLDNLQKVLGQIRTLIRAAVPELALEAEEAEQAKPDTGGAETGDVALPSAGTAAPPAAVIALSDHAEASAALLAAEQYFARAEPSSPALILIHQARMLVGKSLVEALEMLMPEGAAKAMITFSGGHPFQLDMGRMKAITKTATEGAQGNGVAAPPEFQAGTRQEAEALIGSADAFFRAREPSSPIPVLLGKARAFMSRDFSAILSEIVKNGGPAPPAA